MSDNMARVWSQSVDAFCGHAVEIARDTIAQDKLVAFSGRQP